MIVNPDYEVVLFPGGDEFAVIHALDRFCVREKSDQLYHFRLTEESVRRAIGEGFPQEEMLSTLRQHARVPIPQNVLFSVSEWSQRAGVLRLESGTLLSSDDPYVLDRVRTHPELAKHVAEVLEDGALRLKHDLDAKRVRELLKSLGFPVE
ncbi:MAG: helicase-associated domain-containing protein [Planctomycetes bacterium]|nr:helicase-associated domain-containing protein [Planctomycetota bacterium]